MGFFDKFLNRSTPDPIRQTRRPFGFSGGTVVDADTSMQASAFYRGVIYISTQIAKLPWEIKDKNKNILDNNVSYLLNVSPNEEMTAMHFKLYMLQCGIIEGNGYAEIERSMDGRPMALWPLNPRRVSPMRTLSGKLMYEVQNGNSPGDTIYLSPKDMFVVRNLHTRDGIQGQGVVNYAMETLGITLGADRFANSLYANGGLPSGVLNYEGTLSDEAYERLSSSWKQEHGGRRTGATAILENGVTYKPISHAPDVLQFLDSRKFNVLEIARFLGIPPTKLFDITAATYNNIENANLEVATDTLDAWARNLEAEADWKLLGGRRGGMFSEIDLYQVFRGDMETRSTYFKNMMSTGSMKPNEIRNKEGLPGYSDGDRFYIATNNFTPADRVDEVLDSQIKKATQGSGNPPPDKEDDPLNKAIAEYLLDKNNKRKTT